MSIDSIQQLISWQPKEQHATISDGILLPETRLMIFGQAKAWKSMLALHTAFTLANGSNWFGFRTAKTATFKYQVELPKAIDRDRVIKYAKGADSYPPNVFFKTPQDRVKLDTSWGIASFNKDIEEVKSRSPNQQLVVVLDPVYKLIAGHISDEYDVKKFQDNIDESKDKYGYSVIIIHHSRLTRVDASGSVVDLGAEEVMGSSYWNNWCDTMLRVKLLNPHSGADLVEVSFELTRNAQTDLPSFQVQWSRSNLQPTVTKRNQVDTGGEPSIRNIEEEDDGL